MTSHGEREDQEPQAPMLPPTSPGLSVNEETDDDDLDDEEKYPWGRPAPRHIQLFVLGNAVLAVVAALVLIIVTSR